VGPNRVETTSFIQCFRNLKEVQDVEKHQVALDVVPEMVHDPRLNDPDEVQVDEVDVTEFTKVTQVRDYILDHPEEFPDAEGLTSKVTVLAYLKEQGKKDYFKNFR